MGTPTFEIRCVNHRGERYYCYVTPGLTVRALDHNYLLRVISDKLALFNPRRFSLLTESKVAAKDCPGKLEARATPEVSEITEAAASPNPPGVSRLGFLGNLKRRAHRKRKHRSRVGRHLHLQLSCY